jgi:S-adenosylmethionine:tRNA ribosyltransferase-isomerase
MSPERRLTCIRVRNEAFVRLEAFFHARESGNLWRVRIRPAEMVEVSDRLRFGDASENLACFLGFLDADIVEKNGDYVLLSFHFTGAALDDALDRLADPQP